MLFAELLGGYGLGRITSSLLSLWQSFLTHVPALVAAVVVLLLTWPTAKIATQVIRRSLSRSRMRQSLKELFRQFVFLTVWIVGLMVAAIVVFPGMTPAKVLTVLGLSSVAIGFAFKDIFENFFAGVLILWRFPFEPGDYIVCGDIEGSVEDTSIRMTEIRRVDGELVVLPNAILFKQPVRILTNWSSRRVTVICGVAYGEDVDQSRRVIAEAVKACDTVHPDRPVEIFAQEFASSSINFEVTWWTDPAPTPVRRSRDQVVAAVKRALDEAGIEIPFPYRTLTFKEPLRTVGEIAGDNA